jgi:hypothetical protein
MIHDYAS